MKRAHTIRGSALTLALIMAMFFTACSAPQGGDRSDTPPLGGSAVSSADVSSQDAYAPISPMSVRIGTSANGSTNHTIASGMANILTNAIDAYDLVPEVTTGSQENIRLLYSNSVQMAFGMLDVIKYGYEGGREFASDNAPEDPFRYVLGSSPTMIHIFVTERSSCNSIEELIGKRWGVATGAASQYYVPIILGAYGYTLEDISITNMTLQDICNALADDTIDVGVWITPPGSAPIADLAQTNGLRLINVDEEKAKAIMEEHTYFSYLEIPLEAYPNLKASGMALATMNVVFARTDLDEDFVYNFTKIMCENTEELAIIHPKAGEYCVENVLRGSGVIPMHPGAERYYREIGVIS